FFQAEDGIRGLIVTGVQTCALPIYGSPTGLLRVRCKPVGEPFVQVGARLLRERVVGRVANQQVTEAEGIVPRHHGAVRPDQLLRSEERRVGDACGAQWGRGAYESTA